jgi:hypothetical protein
MAYIYKITNTQNGKIYIGKTLNSVEKRFGEHCRDYLRERCEKRPLYAAMRKYGVDNFIVETIEETDNPDERERYWIEYYGSFKNGYNATTGGDGRSYIDVDLIISTYQQLQNITETARRLGICVDTVSKYLHEKKVDMLTSQEIMTQKYGKITNMYDLNGKFLCSFPSTNAAADYMVANNLTGCKKTTIKQHITEVCTGRRKTAAKFKWAYAE